MPTRPTPSNSAYLVKLLDEGKISFDGAPGHRCKENLSMQADPALNVVVYPEPGPEGDIEQHARDFLKRKHVSGTGGGLGYLVLVAADFDRLWTGVANVDVVGTAAAVLHFLGGNAAQFIGRPADFVYGWVGDEDAQQGRVLLLQIVPRPHLLAARRAGLN